MRGIVLHIKWNDETATKLRISNSLQKYLLMTKLRPYKSPGPQNWHFCKSATIQHWLLLLQFPKNNNFYHLKIAAAEKLPQYPKFQNTCALQYIAIWMTLNSIGFNNKNICWKSELKALCAESVQKSMGEKILQASPQLLHRTCVSLKYVKHSK